MTKTYLQCHPWNSLPVSTGPGSNDEETPDKPRKWECPQNWVVLFKKPIPGKTKQRR